MKISVQSITYYININDDEVIELSSKDCELVTETILLNDNVIKCKIHNLGVFLAIDLEVQADINKENVHLIIKLAFKDFLISH